MAAKKATKQSTTKRTSAKKTATKRTAAKQTRMMSDEHKEALARGRQEGRAVRGYLAALEQASRPGRRLSRDEVERRLVAVREQIAAEADPVKRLDLIQKRLDLEERLAEQAGDVDLTKLEAEFVSSAKGYAERKGISYSAFREAGVPAAVLKAADIKRTRRS